MNANGMSMLSLALKLIRTVCCLGVVTIYSTTFAVSKEFFHINGDLHSNSIRHTVDIEQDFLHALRSHQLDKQRLLAGKFLNDVTVKRKRSLLAILKSEFLNPQLTKKSQEQLARTWREWITTAGNKMITNEELVEHLDLIENLMNEKSLLSRPVILGTFFYCVNSLAVRGGTFSERSTLLKIQIHRQLRQLLGSEDPEIKKVAERELRLLKNYVIPVSEEDLIERNILYNRSLESKPKETIQVTLGGLSADLEVSSQLELERRVRVVLPHSGLFYSFKLGQSLNGFLTSVSDVVRAMLDTWYFNRGSKNPLSFWPLGTYEEWWHSKKLVARKKIEGKKDIPVQFTDDLPNLLKLGEENDSISATYHVVHQREVGLYYDTSDLALRDQGIALRTKEWHRPGEVKENPAQSLFVKINEQTEQDSIFSPRIEYEANLEGFPQELRDPAMKTLLSHAGVREVDSLHLKPVVKVDNKRYGFNLIWRNTIKIGYVVIDTYQRTILEQEHKGESLGEDGIYSQFEVELLPEYQELFEMNKADFVDFFKEIETALGGEPHPIPKYLGG